MQARRQLKRWNVPVSVQIFNTDNGEYLGRLGDIHTKGVRLISNIPIDLNKNYHLKIALPKEFIDGEEITFNAKSVWSVKNIAMRKHTAGFELLNIPINELEKIEQFISEYGI